MERHFTFLYIAADDTSDITEHDATIDGGLLQAFDYAKEHIRPKAKPGTTIHIFEFHNGDSVGAVKVN